MRRYLRGRRGLAGITLALAALPLAVGIAYATIPDGQGVIHSCLKNGDLRVIDTATQSCKANEAGLSWNQQGPQGIQGETGPQGPPGPAGSNANVEGFADTGSATTSVEDEVWGDFHLVLEEPVPAGSFLVTATVNGRVNGAFSLPPNTTGGGVGKPRFECFLRKNAPSISEPALFRATTPLEDGGTVVIAGQPAPFFRESSVALTGAYSATEPTTPQVHCELGFSTRTIGFEGSLRFDGNMTIVKAGSLG
jgi:hypothetical protein